MYKLISIAVSAIILTASMAKAQFPGCANPHDEVVAALAKKYQETIVAIGVTNRGDFIEVLSNPKNETWTIIVTTPQGCSTLVTSGEGWRSMGPISIEPEA